MDIKWFFAVVFVGIQFSSGVLSGNADQTLFNPQLSTENSIVIQSDANHCGTINSNETWISTDDVHIITCDVIVAHDITLTIEEGAIVKFQSNKTLFVQGSLRVLGADANPVYFTSIKDDSIGGDTNNDGSASLPARGDWGRIEFQDSSDDNTSLIEFATIRYAGSYWSSGNKNYGGIELVGASPTIQNSQLSTNDHYAIRGDVNSFPQLTNNAYIDNTINGLAIQGGTIATDTMWDMTDTSYYLIDDFYIQMGVTLTINEGVVVKAESDHMINVLGALRILGTTTNPVYFTSQKDDTLKGDTNNDGATSTPGPGDWGRIEFQDTSNDVTSVINNVEFRYGGNFWSPPFQDHGVIEISSASPTIENSKFINNKYYAILADLESSPTLTNNTYIKNGINGLAILGGTIIRDTNWDMTDAAYYLTDDVMINMGSALTIQPGVVVKLDDYHSIKVLGTLRVLGNASEPIYFTSKRDDSVKGDTNNDGAASFPKPADWGRIEFQDASDDETSLIDNAIIRYGGNDSLGLYQNGAIELISASPTIKNSTLSNNFHYALRADLGSLPQLINNSYINNSINGLGMRGGTIVSATTWNPIDTAYYVIDDISIQIGVTLTINSGVVVKFRDPSNLIVLGALRAIGTYDKPIYFTSQMDDAIKGDTNNDGASSMPMPGSWGRILFQDTSDDSTSLIEYSTIRYGGKPDNNGGVELVSASPTIRNSTITRNQYGLVLAESFPTLGCNNIITNNSFGVYNATPSISITAQNQWWGSSTGPYHPTSNATGLGNQVSDGVSYIPWSSQVCGPTPTFADVPTTHIFWRYIEGFYAKGITTGCAINPLRFCPDNLVTRSAMAVFLLRAMNGTEYQPPAATGIFTDLPVTGKEWMQPWVEEFYREGITTGCSTDPLQYCPENSVTRASMAVFLLRAKYGANYQPPAATGIFADLPVTGKEWMEPWVEQFYWEGITTGCGVEPLRYCPEDPVKRQAMAVFIDRAFGFPQLP